MTDIVTFAASGQKSYFEIEHFLLWEYGIVHVLWIDPILNKCTLINKRQDNFIFSRHHVGIIFPEHACMVYMGHHTAQKVDGIGPRINNQFNDSYFQVTYYNKVVSATMYTPMYIVCTLDPNTLHVPQSNGSLRSLGGYLRQRIRSHKKTK